MFCHVCVSPYLATPDISDTPSSAGLILMFNMFSLLLAFMSIDLHTFPSVFCIIFYIVYLFSLFTDTGLIFLLFFFASCWSCYARFFVYCLLLFLVYCDVILFFVYYDMCSWPFVYYDVLLFHIYCDICTCSFFIMT